MKMFLQRFVRRYGETRNICRVSIADWRGKRIGCEKLLATFGDRSPENQDGSNWLYRETKGVKISLQRVPSGGTSLNGCFKRAQFPSTPSTGRNLWTRIIIGKHMATFGG